MSADFTEESIMVTFKIPYVLRYGTAPVNGKPDNRPYRYRRVVPSPLRKKIGRRNWFKTWRLGTPDDEIQREARSLAVKHDNEIRVAKGEKVESEAAEILGGPPVEMYQILTMFAENKELFGKLDPGAAALVQRLQGDKAPDTSPLLSVARDTDIEAGRGGTDTRPIRYAVKHFIEVIGDRPVTDIARADVETWLASFTGAPATTRRRLASICGLMNRTFLSLEINQMNPFAKHRIKDSNGNSKRLPFSAAHLNLIDAHLTSPRVNRDTRNIVNMLRNTGCRLSEIGGLVVSDVRLDDGDIPFITIRDNATRGVKSDAGTRRVPLIGVAFTAAQDAMEHAKKRVKGHNPDKVALFTCFTGSPASAKALSTKCGNVIRGAGIASKRLTTHSLRHTIIEALKCTGLADRVLKRIVGHAGQGVTAGYGSPQLRLTESRDALVAALEILGDVDESIYSEAEKLK